MIVDRDYPDHWKTIALKQATGLPDALVFPLRLWGHCEARRDDFIADTTGRIIAGICRVSTIGPKELLTALLECGFLDKEKGGYRVHGWAERNAGWLAKVQAGRNRIANAKRAKSGQLSTSKQPATDQLAGSKQDASTPAMLPKLDAVEWSGVEKSRIPAEPSTARGADEMGSEGAGKVLSETANRILALFDGKKRRLGREAEGELARNTDALPLVDEEWRLIEWWLRLPCDEADPFLRDGSRPKDADKLAIRLFSELDRARGHAKKIAGPQKKETPAPGGWPEWFQGKFPGKPVPPTFADLPDYLQNDARRELQSERSAA